MYVNNNNNNISGIRNCQSYGKRVNVDAVEGLKPHNFSSHIPDVNNKSVFLFVCFYNKSQKGTNNI